MDNNHRIEGDTICDKCAVELHENEVMTTQTGEYATCALCPNCYNEETADEDD